MFRASPPGYSPSTSALILSGGRRFRSDLRGQTRGADRIDKSPEPTESSVPGFVVFDDLYPTVRGPDYPFRVSVTTRSSRSYDAPGRRDPVPERHGSAWARRPLG